LSDEIVNFNKLIFCTSSLSGLIIIDKNRILAVDDVCKMSVVVPPREAKVAPTIKPTPSTLIAVVVIVAEFDTIARKALLHQKPVVKLLAEDSETVN